jgi:hypothetical protein
MSGAMKKPIAPIVAAHIEAWGGRRFLITLGAGIVDAVLVWHGKISGTDYVTLTIATVGAFIGANTWQKREQIKAGVTAEATKQLGEGNRPETTTP